MPQEPVKNNNDTIFIGVCSHTSLLGVPEVSILFFSSRTGQLDSLCIPLSLHLSPSTLYTLCLSAPPPLSLLLLAPATLVSVPHLQQR